MCIRDRLKNLPRFYPPTLGPQIVFKYNGTRNIARYLYHVQAFKPRLSNNFISSYDGKITIITNCETPQISFEKRKKYHKDDYDTYYKS